MCCLLVLNLVSSTLSCIRQPRPRLRPGEAWTWAAPVSETGITGGGSGYAAILAHAEGALYGTELGSVTLKRIGFFCFPIKHSRHTGFWDGDYGWGVWVRRPFGARGWSSVRYGTRLGDLKENWFLQIIPYKGSPISLASYIASVIVSDRASDNN